MNTDKYQWNEIENGIELHIPTGPAQGCYQILCPVVDADGLIFVGRLDIGGMQRLLRLKASDMPGLVRWIDARAQERAERRNVQPDDTDRQMIEAGFEVGDGYWAARTYSKMRGFDGSKF